MAEGQALPQATFIHTNPHNISEIWTATKFYISMCSFFFSIHKVTSLRVGRSRDPLLQKANYFVTNVNIKTLHFQFAIYLTQNEWISKDVYK